MKKKRATPDHIKEAADRAAARSSGKKPKKSRVPIDPAVAKAKSSAPPTPAPTPGRGRPTDYDPAFVEQVRKLCNLGATDEEIGDFFGVSTRTVYRWKLQHEDFCQALRAGKDLADDRVERSLYQKATGFVFVEQTALKVKVDRDVERVEVVDVERFAPPDTQASLHWLYNRRPERWRNLSRTELTGKNGGAIEVSDQRTAIEMARWIAFKLSATVPADATPDPKLIEDTTNG